MELKEIILWVLIALLAVAVIYVVFFRGASNESIVSAGKSVAGSYGGMVGGC